ncbi:uncharacterized protein EV420DRAFT_1144992 [Desarmillaria tabescens]|uniref:Protein kinase domain-containing protein n=1 Tax=Armillaria tabescens TaxID=1929756 RepID=A0AA39NC84_ARMTA|nr:uncharacterized protein EV420DRAFT_1144992 [Desarmillaria tabescens]KAK0462921.1 hypothetical protein EV420DRAFT_1144992 [Desarmillaria tabescens]
MSEPLDETTLDPNNAYFPGACYQLHTVAPPCFPSGDRWCHHNGYSRQPQRTEGVYALSLANHIPFPPSPSLSITLSDRLSGGIREHITHVWTARTSSPIPEKTPTTVIAKFYDPLYFHDEYESIDPLRLATRSAASEVKAYEMLQSLQGISIPRCLGLYATAIPEQDGRTVYVLLLELVAGKGLHYLCETGGVEEDNLLIIFARSTVMLSSQPCSGWPWNLSVMASFMQIGLQGTLSSNPRLVEVLFVAMDIVQLDSKSTQTMLGQ